MTAANPSERRYQFEPDYTVAPGTTLREALSSQGMSQAELATRAGLSLKHVNQIVQGLAPITHETAIVLEKVTGVPALVWNNLEARYRDYLARAREKKVEQADLDWLRSLPIKELTKRGFLSGHSDQARLLQEMYRFFGVASREAWEKVWRAPLAAFRKSPTYASDASALAAWLRIGELEAASVECKPFDPKRFRNALQEIRRLTCKDPSEFSKRLVEICSEAGVAVVFVPEITGCRASGAARWLTPLKAVVQLSLRHKTDDHLWFSFFHEAGHLLIHGKKETFVSDGSGERLEEEEANRFAASTLIPRAHEPQLQTLQNTEQMRQFADQLGIAPGIVVGRLQKEGLLPWNQGNSLKRRLQIVDE